MPLYYVVRIIFRFETECNYSFVIETLVKIEMEDRRDANFPFTYLYIFRETNHFVIFVDEDANNYFFTFPKTCFSVPSGIIFPCDGMQYQFFSNISSFCLLSCTVSISSNVRYPLINIA